MRAAILALPLLAIMGAPAGAQDLVVQFYDGGLSPQPLPAYPTQRVITLPGNLYTPERVATLVPDTTYKVIYNEQPPRRIYRRSVVTTEFVSDDPYDYRH